MALQNRDLTIAVKTSAELSGLTQTEQAIGRLDDKQASNMATLKRWQTVGTMAAIAVGTATVTATAVAVESYATYESSLSKLRQASSATNDEMARMTKLSRELGKDTSLAGVTASDAALAMVELSKAGLAVNDTMDASRGVLSLAKAGNIDFASAATIAASALNAFGLEGKDATMVADMLAAGANASQADLAGLADGMQQSATVAKQFKLSLNDNVTALSLFANSGIRGSDAGTSLKTMLISLAKPSAAASEAMTEVGFSAYDASGEFVGLREMSIRLQKSLEGLTDEQKQNTLATIFGTDAFRAAAILAENAGTSYDKMSTAVGRTGAAQEAAKANLGQTQKALENLSNAFSDVGLEIGSRFSPAVTEGANVMASNLMPALNTATTIFNANMPIIAGAAAAWGAYKLITIAVTGATVIQTAAQVGLNAVMSANPVGLLLTLFAGLGTAMVTSMMMTNGAKDATTGLNSAQDNLRNSTDALKDAKDRLSGADTTLEGAHLSVERATRNLNDAIARYGQGSLEAREAANQLERANQTLRTSTDDQKRASDGVTDALVKESVAKERARIEAEKMAGAQTNLKNKTADAKGVISGFGGTVDEVTGKISWQRGKVEDLQSRLQAMQGKTYNYTVIGNIQENKASAGATKKARGGQVHGGSPYVVGDNPDGTFNSTTELFVPDSNGQIFSAKDLQKAISGGFSSIAGTGGSNITNNINVNVTTPEAAREVFAMMNGDMRLVNKGMAMSGGGY